MTKKITYSLLVCIISLGAFFSAYCILDRKDAPLSEQPTVIENETEKEAAKKPRPDSIPAMAEMDFEGDTLQLGRVLDDNGSYPRHFVTYRSEGLVISGIMNIPKGQGPFPVVFLNHGYVAPEDYSNGQYFRREQDFFARNGYAVFQSDYRGYGSSDPDPDEDIRPRSGYVEDVLNAISAVKKAGLPSVDTENVFMLGHSMGGGVTLNIMVTKPEIAQAYALLAPINADYRVNFEKWVKTDNDFDGIAEKFYARYGTYEEAPETWESFSAKNYFDRITSPVMLHQGTLDRDVPVEWSRGLMSDLEKAGKDITYHEYPGEGHTLYAAQDMFMRRTLDFFNGNLK